MFACADLNMSDLKLFICDGSLIKKRRYVTASTSLEKIRSTVKMSSQDTEEDYVSRKACLSW